MNCREHRYCAERMWYGKGCMSKVCRKRDTFQPPLLGIKWPSFSITYHLFISYKTGSKSSHFTLVNNSNIVNHKIFLGSFNYIGNVTHASIQTCIKKLHTMFSQLRKNQMILQRKILRYSENL